MLDSYLTLAGEGREEFSVSRSRFIGWAKPISAEEEALDLIGAARKEYWDASHHVWAYILGADRERFSDGGEPQGTAGRPVLEVLRKEGLRDAAVVVTRYFGGIKLGAGGLARAYTRGAGLALAAGKITRRRAYLVCRIKAGYAFAEKLQRECGKMGYRIKESEYAEEVSFTVLVPPEEAEALELLAAGLTAGRASVEHGAAVYLSGQ